MDTTLPLALRCLALDAAAVVASETLRRSGIDSVLLKGAGLAHRLAADRFYGDIDLLVAPSEFDAAQDALAAAGYRRRLPERLTSEWMLWHERPWTIPETAALTVDLHRGFAGVGDAEALWRVLRAGATPMRLADGTVLIPDEAGTALLLALHAAAPGRLVKPSTDLARGLDVLPVPVWSAATALAARCAATTAYAIGLRVVPAGAALADRFGLPEGSGSPRWLIAHRATPTAVTLARLAELPGRRQRLRRFVRLVLPPPAYLRCAEPWARSGPVGLLLAYAMRIARHLRWLPRAVREYRSARSGKSDPRQ